MDQVEKSVSCRRRRRVRSLHRCATIATRVTAVCAMLLAPGSGLADSNLPQDYPAHQCGDRPDPPSRPEKFRDRAELDGYNEKVEAYNVAMEEYVDCLQSYVDNAASDIRTIRKQIEAALEAVKR